MLTECTALSFLDIANKEGKSFILSLGKQPEGIIVA
jgi:hypothetical protein